MIPPNYVQSLVTYADLGDVEKQQIIDEYRDLFDRMKAGEGQLVVNSSGNGRAFGLQISMTVEEQFSAYGDAVRIINSSTTGDSAFTFPDFSGMI